MIGEHIKNFGIDFAIKTPAFAGSAALAAQTAIWVGSSIVAIPVLPALAFGACVGAISSIAGQILKNVDIFKNRWANLAVSVPIGFGATLGLSYAAVALGFIAAPITIPTALILTVAGLATVILINLVCELACKNTSSKTKATAPTPPPSNKPKVEVDIELEETSKTSLKTTPGKKIGVEIKEESSEEEEVVNH